MQGVEEGNGERGGKRRLMGLVRVAVALLILALVARTLSWKDHLTWHAGADTSTVVGGIEGDWKESRVDFRVTDLAELPPEWPEEARAATRRGESFPVTRRAPGAEGYEWQPSILSAFGEVETGGIVFAMGLFVLSTLLAVTRWWRLLLLAGCPTSWFNALRLTYVGLFFNLVMPGMTGGDVVKGVVAAKENPLRRADAIVSVIVDRVIGLAALAILAIVVILASGEKFAELRTPLIGLLLVGALGLALYAKKSLRKKLGLSALVDRLPLGDKLRSVDRAALLYLRHPLEIVVAFLFSFGNHLVICAGVWALGVAVGVKAEEAGLREFLVVTPVANMLAAIPLAPGGWGIGEAAYKELFELMGVSGALGVAVSVISRLCMQVGLGSIGSVFLLFPGVRAEVRAER